VAVVTKAGVAGEDRAAEVAAEVEGLLARTTLAGSPVHVVDSVAGAGLDGLRASLEALASRVGERLAASSSSSSVAAPGVTGVPAPRLAVDRVFAVRGRGTVVTGSLRGGRLTAGMTLRLVPGGREVRIREVQVRGATVEAADGGRTALLLGGVEAGDLRRGAVLTTDPAVAATSRVLVAMRPAARLVASTRGTGPAVAADRERLRLHLGTDQAGALVVRGPREAIDLPDGSALAILRLDAVIAAAPGDRFALRRPSPGSTAGGGVVLDAVPPRGVSRRRLTSDRAAGLVAAPVGSEAARVELHGALPVAAGWAVADDVRDALAARAVALVADHHAADPASAGLALPAPRAALAIAARRLVTLDRTAADHVARDAVDRLVAGGRLARDGDLVRDPTRGAGPAPETLAAMDRLEAALAVAAPPSLAEAARAAGCPLDGIRALEAAGRIVRLEDDLAWAAGTYRELVRRALAMAAAAPLSPAAFRDATGTSRRFVLVILEDLDRRGLLRRTEAGHVLGPKTLARMQERAQRAAGEAT
jgi:selenocysteine-specific elongation factor